MSPATDPGGPVSRDPPYLERHGLLIGLALFVLPVLLYGRVWWNEFVRFDDFEYIVDNPAVRAGLSLEGFRWAFGFHQANWHPLTWLSHQLDCALFGLRPGPHHMMSVLLHALNAVLLYLGLKALTRATWPSWVVAALFAVHPLRVESVAWASERKDVLAGLFWMLTLLAYTRYVRRPGALRYSIVCGSLALGLMAKPMLVTLPLVLLLLDAWPLRRWSPRAPRGAPDARAIPLLVEKIPLLGIAAASGIVTVLAQRSGGAIQALEGLPAAARIGNAALSYVGYLWKTLWPSGLAFYYPHPALVGSPSSVVVRGIAAAGFLVIVTGLALFAIRRRPYVSVGWFWYLITLGPVIGLFQVGNQAMADRYTYVPLIGIYVVVVWGIREWLAARESFRIPVVGAVVVILAALGSVTWVQVGTWRNSLVLFDHAARVTRDNYVAHNNLGNAYLRSGDLLRAAESYREAIRIKPDLAQAHNNLGSVSLRQRKPAAAIPHFEEALRLDPEYVEASYNMGIALREQGRLDEAERAFRRAIEIRPALGEGHARLGDLALERGRLEQALSHYRAALAASPSLARVAGRLAWLLATSGEDRLRDGAEAIRWAEHCADIAGREDPFVLEILAAAYAEAGDFERATRLQQAALAAVSEEHRAAFSERLRTYRTGRAHREPRQPAGEPAS